MQANAFIKRASGLAPDLRCVVGYSDFTNSGLGGVPSKGWMAIWDTGANLSVISKAIVDDLGIKPVSIQEIKTVSGAIQTNCYYVNVWIPDVAVAQRVLVLEGEISGADALIGMDIIRCGDFAVTNYNGKTAFTFRIPSLGELDFVQNSYLVPARKVDTPSRNEQCPCGSGKKYKNCCGQKQT